MQNKNPSALPQENRRLSISMLKHIGRVYELLKPDAVDVEFLKPYRDLVSDTNPIDISQLVELGSKVLYAFDLCRDASVVARALVGVGELRVDQEMAKSHLLRAPAHFTANSIRSTDKMTTAFVDQDPMCVAEIDLLNQWKAISDFFEKSRQSFENWHNWFKKLYGDENAAMNDSRRMGGHNVTN